jgi:hypothetical protein
MKRARFIRGVFVSLAVVGLCVPEVALAAEQTPPPVITDIALAEGGTLHGQLVDLRAGGVAGAPVSLRAQDREVAATTTRSDGRFEVPGLRGGVYQLAAGQGNGIYRFWSPGTAPPAAQKGAIVYTQNGGGQGGGLKMLLANPVVVAGIVATAIAVPVALSNSRPASP